MGLYLSTSTSEMKYIRIVHKGTATNNFGVINGVTSTATPGTCVIRSGLVLKDITRPENPIICTVKKGP
jgi:hypothetical protein